jgi:hypothetical protein
MNSRVLACIMTLPIVAMACATQPDFTFYDDQLDGSPDAAIMMMEKPTSDATVLASPETGAESEAPADDGPTQESMDDGGSPDAEAAIDASDSGGADAGGADAGAAGAPDGGAEAGLEAGGGAVEAGCGPLDTITQCGACDNACDKIHSNPVECEVRPGDASTCVYSSCAGGFADCIPAAPDTNGCETPITTVANCTGCGLTCDTANTIDAGCGASGCTYTCALGYGNCNPTAPNTAGCSTALTTAANCGSCGNTCTGTGTSTCTEHVNSLGSYYDCYGINVHNYTTAHDACAAYTGDPSADNCQTFGCTGDPNTWAVVCSNEIDGNPSACVCWEYIGGQIGRYDTGCECPATYDPTWE